MRLRNVDFLDEESDKFNQRVEPIRKQKPRFDDDNRGRKPMKRASEQRNRAREEKIAVR